MSARPYHKRYHSDALAGFMSLTLEERGAYQTLLDMMYDRRGPILDNERLLAGYMQVSIRKWRSLRETLIRKGKIQVTSDGHLSNSRVEKELENDAKTIRKLAENGSKGGRTRAENQKKPNEINGRGQAGLNRGSSLNQIPDARDQSNIVPFPEIESNTNASHSVPQAAPGDVERLVAVWNAMAAGAGLPKVRKVSAAKAQTVRHRIRDYGFDELAAALRSLPKNKWVTTEWRPDFGKMMEARICEGLINGRYAPKGDVRVGVEAMSFTS